MEHGFDGWFNISWGWQQFAGWLCILKPICLRSTPAMRSAPPASGGVFVKIFDRHSQMTPTSSRGNGDFDFVVMQEAGCEFSTFGDAAFFLFAAGGVFAGGEAEVTHELLGMGESNKVADLGNNHEGGDDFKAFEAASDNATVGRVFGPSAAYSHSFYLVGQRQSKESE